MKGLLLKDWYMMLRRYRYILPFCVLFLALITLGSGTDFLFLLYPSIIAAVLPISLFAFDERERWLSFCGALPVSRTAYVSAKYLLAPITLAGLLLLTAAGEAVLSLVRGEAAFRMLPQMTAVCVMCLAMPAILLPLMLRFGAEKGRIMYYILIGATAGAVAVVAPRFTAETAVPAGLPLPLLTAAGVLYALSWLLSVWLYRRRELNG